VLITSAGAEGAAEHLRAPRPGRPERRCRGWSRPRRVLERALRPAVYPLRVFVIDGGLIVRARYDRSIPAAGWVHWSHPQRRETGRPAGAVSDQVRIVRQP